MLRPASSCQPEWKPLRSEYSRIGHGLLLCPPLHRSVEVIGQPNATGGLSLAGILSRLYLRGVTKMPRMFDVFARRTRDSLARRRVLLQISSSSQRVRVTIRRPNRSPPQRHTRMRPRTNDEIRNTDPADRSDGLHPGHRSRPRWTSRWPSKPAWTLSRFRRTTISRCKIMDTGKFKYSARRRPRSRKRSRRRLRSRDQAAAMIDDARYDVKMRAAARFRDRPTRSRFTFALQAAAKWPTRKSAPRLLDKGQGRIAE